MMKAPLRPGTRPVGAAQLAVEDTLTDGPPEFAVCVGLKKMGFWGVVMIFWVCGVVLVGVGGIGLRCGWDWFEWDWFERCSRNLPCRFREACLR